MSDDLQAMAEALMAHPAAKPGDFLIILRDEDNPKIATRMGNRLGAEIERQLGRGETTDYIIAAVPECG